MVKPILIAEPNGQLREIKNSLLISRNWPFGSAISIGLTILMALLIFVYYRANKLLNKKVELE